MKKVAFLFVVVLLLSSVAFAGQSQQLPASNGEFDQTTDSNVESNSYFLKIKHSYVGEYLWFNDGNYSGKLYYQGKDIYAGWVYGTGPQPWSLTDR